MANQRRNPNRNQGRNAKEVFFSEVDDGYRATPGNQVASVKDDEIVFWNISGQPAQLELPLRTVQQARGAKAGFRTTRKAIAPGKSFRLPLANYQPGQYFYRVLIAGLDVKGNSSPGIIITP